MAKEVFKFDLDDKVVFHDAIEVTGTVIGRVEYTNKESQYLIRYMDGTGSPCEHWWDEDALMEDDNAGEPEEDEDAKPAGRRRRDDD